FLMDNLPEYSPVRIFGDGASAGISGDSGQDGQWRTYYANVATWQRGMLWTDPTLAGSPTSTYPSLDVDDSPLPELSTQGTRGLGPGNAAPTATTEATPPAGATTPASAVQALTAPPTAEAGPGGTSPAAKPDAAPVPVVGGVEMGGDFEVDPNTVAAKSPSLPASMPADMTTVSAAAKVMRMTPAAFIRWARAQGLTLIPVP